MTKRTDTDFKTVLIAVLAGAAAGLAVGLLMAPKSGDKLRGDIGRSVEEYLESARRKADELKTSAANLAQRGLREVQRTKDAATAKADVAVDTGAAGAHHAIDQTVDAVNYGARKGHEAVDYAAGTLRTGTQG